jgi:CxxC motif-containing protein
MESKRILTCIVCPRGCALTVTLDGNNVTSVEGNICQRGKKYAEDECINPKRTVTSTVRCADGGVVAVKTSDTVAKSKVFDVMKEINGATAPATVKIGSVIIENVCGTGVDVIATAEKR